MPAFNVALIQICSGCSQEENVASVARLVRHAAADGADMVCTPETSALMARNREEMFANIVTEEQDAALAAWRNLAQETGVWLLLGSLCVLPTLHDSAQLWETSPRKAVNRSFVIAPDGDIKARYDKLHLFDVDLPDGERHRESESYQAGDAAVTAQLPWGMLGMSICYDLRFPALYRELARRGAVFLSVPAAFTHQTGAAHWHVLLRARAIENACYVFAPAQAGRHENGRHTYGHSLIIDPWGRILADAGEAPERVITARVDTREADRMRSGIPVLKHEKPLGFLQG